jgi:hypothetical protein
MMGGLAAEESVAAPPRASEAAHRARGLTSARRVDDPSVLFGPPSDRLSSDPRTERWLGVSPGETLSP